MDEAPHLFRTGRAARPTIGDPRAGYLLIELTAALAVVALGLGLLFPLIPARTTPSRFLGVVTAAAALLRDARSAALAGGGAVVAVFDAQRRELRAGAERVAIPSDVGVTLLTGGHCPAAEARAGILFRPDGTNCGGIFRFTHETRIMRALVDWVDGRIDVAEGG